MNRKNMLEVPFVLVVFVSPLVDCDSVELELTFKEAWLKTGLLIFHHPNQISMIHRFICDVP